MRSDPYATSSPGSSTRRMRWSRRRTRERRPTANVGPCGPRSRLRGRCAPARRRTPTCDGPNGRIDPSLLCDILVLGDHQVLRHALPDLVAFSDAYRAESGIPLHGPGTAVDEWMVANGPRFGRAAPEWPLPNGGDPEPWRVEHVR